MKRFERKKRYWGVLLIPIILLVVGCAPKKEVEPLPTAEPPNLIKGIQVVDRDEGKRIIIEGESPLVYTFFKLVPEPLKLVVDIPQTELAKDVLSPITVGDDVITEILASQQEGRTEISIGLNKLVKYQVEKEGTFLSIDFGERAPLVAKDEQKKEEVGVVEEIPAPVQEEVVAEELAPAQN